MHIKQQQNDMKTTSIIIEKISESDRMIILFIKEGQIQGINYLQDISADTEIICDFMTANVSLTKFVKEKFATSIWADHYEDMHFVHPSPNYWEIINCIDEFIWAYVKKHQRITEIKIEISNLNFKIEKLKAELTTIQK